MKDGILNKDYIKKRNGKGTYYFRMKRRAFECSFLIKKYIKKQKTKILDLGCADGKFSSFLKKELPVPFIYTGIEYNYKLLEPSETSLLISGDINQLPLKKDIKFDVIILAAVLEHIKQPEKLLKQLEYHLNQNGIIIITMPDPFFEKIASLMKNLDEGDFHNPLNYNKLNKVIQNTPFKIEHFNKFMISPWGFIQERKIEPYYPNILKLNQIFILKFK